MGSISNELLILNFVVVIIVVASYAWIRRRPRQPVTLKLKNPEPKLPLAAADSKPLSRSERYKVFVEMPIEAAAEAPFEKTLNVLFNYNGHTWDAFEVLGLPAGSSPAAAQEAFTKLCQQVQPESVEFLQAALAAIRNETNTQKKII